MPAAPAWLLLALTLGLRVSTAARDANADMTTADADDLRRRAAASVRQHLSQQMAAVKVQAKKFRRHLGHHGPTRKGVAAIDPDEDAQAMLSACGSEDFGSGSEALSRVRRCATELQSYAQLSRRGLQGTLQAEEVFVAEYEKAAKFLAMLGDTSSLWDNVQKDQHAALSYLLSDANKADSTARGLKIFGALRPTTTQPRLPFELEDSEGEEDSEEDEAEDEEESEVEGSRMPVLKTTHPPRILLQVLLCAQLCPPTPAPPAPPDGAEDVATGSDRDCQCRLGIREHIVRILTAHAVTCNVTESACDGGNMWYAPGYVSPRSGCCHCQASCENVSDSCSYYDAVEQPQDENWGCYDASVHRCDCDESEVGCAAKGADHTWTSGCRSCASQGSCYDVTSHAVSCDVPETACASPSSWYAPGYVSPRSGCCHCRASCQATSENCTHYDEIDPPQQETERWGCYDMASHSCECDTTEAACAGTWTRSCSSCDAEDNVATSGAATRGAVVSLLVLLASFFLTEAGTGCYNVETHKCDCSTTESQCHAQQGAWTDGCRSCDAVTNEQHPECQKQYSWGCFDEASHACQCTVSERACDLADNKSWTHECWSCCHGSSWGCFVPGDGPESGCHCNIYEGACALDFPDATWSHQCFECEEDQERDNLEEQSSGNSDDAAVIAAVAVSATVLVAAAGVGVYCLISRILKPKPVNEPYNSPQIDKSDVVVGRAVPSAGTAGLSASAGMRQDEVTEGRILLQVLLCAQLCPPTPAPPATLDGAEDVATGRDRDGECRLGIRELVRTAHAVTCNVTESACDGGNMWYAPGYVSPRSGCCHCQASCENVSDSCSYYDAVEQPQDENWGCYDASVHRCDCAQSEVGCAAKGADHTWTSGCRSCASQGSCYDVTSHAVSCDVPETACASPSSWYAPGYVSPRSGCCHCMASCQATSENCTYYDEIDPPQQETERWGCYDMASHSCECDTTEAACAGTWTRSCSSCDAEDNVATSGAATRGAVVALLVLLASFFLTEAGTGCYNVETHKCDCSTTESQCHAQQGAWTDGCRSCDAVSNEQHPECQKQYSWGCFDEASHACQCTVSERACDLAANKSWTHECWSCCHGSSWGCFVPGGGPESGCHCNIYEGACALDFPDATWSHQCFECEEDQERDNLEGPSSGNSDDAAVIAAVAVSATALVAAAGVGVYCLISRMLKPKPVNEPYNSPQIDNSDVVVGRAVPSAGTAGTALKESA
ncbi:unnamed protein product [Symbiodinium natans]|uniref:Uncharacterized protein n=1 Tax=Symbiodinium natans TaxID=878477 RepID=A0A812NXV6_9DINO|nr:unnamed protein product [Symbiodinium natans]